MPLKDLEARKIYSKAYAERNAEKLRLYREEYRLKNKEDITEKKKLDWVKNAEENKRKLRERYAANIEKYRAISQRSYADNALKNCEVAAQYRLNNMESVKASKKQYAQNNKHVINAAVARRRAAKLQRTPAWLTEDDHWMIKQTYELATLRTKMFGFQWHVDHVVPLQGETVSGLHVPWNLQVIPAKINVSKKNRWDNA